MDTHRANSSSSRPEFYWHECAVFSNDSTIVVSYSVGLYILFSSNTSELIIGIPLNIWLICHILNKRCFRICFSTFWVQYCYLIVKFLIHCI